MPLCTPGQQPLPTDYLPVPPDKFPVAMDAEQHHRGDGLPEFPQKNLFLYLTAVFQGKVVTP